jgi:hypothetical protein
MHYGLTWSHLKKVINNLPYSLFYGKYVMLPLHLELNAISLATIIEDEERDNAL